MSAYGWIITKDLTGVFDSGHGDGPSVGTTGPHGCNEGRSVLLRGVASGATPFPASAHRFKIYADDGEHYYSGVIVGSYTGLEPLDDFGTPNAGATSIKIRRTAEGVRPEVWSAV